MTKYIVEFTVVADSADEAHAKADDYMRGSDYNLLEMSKEEKHTASGMTHPHPAKDIEEGFALLEESEYKEILQLLKDLRPVLAAAVPAHKKVGANEDKKRLLRRLDTILKS